jgi:chromosomal replication initiation ATPase DnaA
LLKKVANRFGVDSEELRSGSKVATVSKARAVLCYLGVRRHGLTVAHISKELGIIPSAVSRAVSRAQKADRNGSFGEK